MTVEGDGVGSDRLGLVTAWCGRTISVDQRAGKLGSVRMSEGDRAIEDAKKLVHNLCGSGKVSGRPEPLG